MKPQYSAGLAVIVEDSRPRESRAASTIAGEWVIMTCYSACTHGSLEKW